MKLWLGMNKGIVCILLCTRPYLLEAFNIPRDQLINLTQGYFCRRKCL